MTKQIDRVCAVHYAVTIHIRRLCKRIHHRHDRMTEQIDRIGAVQRFVAIHVSADILKFTALVSHSVRLIATVTFCGLCAVSIMPPIFTLNILT